MLTERRLVDRDGVRISDVSCRHADRHGSTDEHLGGHSIVFVRRGCFVRSADGREVVLDPTVAYCIRPGEEERYDHPHDGGDDCTWFRLDRQLAASLWGGDPSLPSGPLPIPSLLDLEHRLLLAGCRSGAADPTELAERAIALVAGALAQADSRRTDAGRPATARARRAVVDGAREALLANPERSLPDLARDLAVSPYHLSRLFHAATGHTVARHRMHLRTRAALERLAGGERSLARLAADLGFADQSHLCRVLRNETGRTPSALRRLLTEERRPGEQAVVSASC